MLSRGCLGVFGGTWHSMPPNRRCAAMAATGHLSSVKYMQLCDMELPSSEDMPCLARVVNVAGDVGPLVTSLTCTALWIEDMELDQAATSSLVLCLQHSVQELTLAWGVRLHTQTLVEYDWQGQCERCVQVDYYEVCGQDVETSEKKSEVLIFTSAKLLIFP